MRFSNSTQNHIPIPIETAIIDSSLFNADESLSEEQPSQGDFSSSHQSKPFRPSMKPNYFCPKSLNWQLNYQKE